MADSNRCHAQCHVSENQELEHGLKTVDNIHCEHDHKISKTLAEKAKLTRKIANE